MVMYTKHKSIFVYFFDGPGMMGLAYSERSHS